MKPFKDEKQEKMKNRFSFKTFINHPKGLFWYYILINMVPSFYFFFHTPTNFIGKIITLLFPLGVYLLLFSLVKNTGKWQIFFFPILFIHAFQIVLFYLYGEGAIASDMFLNVVTTNSSEIGELLGALLPSIVIVCCLYIPPLILGGRQWKKKIYPPHKFRIKTLISALVLLLLSGLLSFFATNNNGKEYTFYNNVYPINAYYNLGFAIQKDHKIKSLPETTQHFSFRATRTATDTMRTIIVLVIGETSRADHWGLYGYSRKTTPQLKKEKNLIFYRDAITQANVTHKSVAIILSSVGAKDYDKIYRQKSIFEAFNEVGFTTAFLSNQPESNFILFFGKEANIYKMIRQPEANSGNYDGKLLPEMRKVIQNHSGNLFIVLHTYGSHFNYRDRYPGSFRKYTPDSVSNVTASQKTKLVNAYDNSILYTDDVLSRAINILKHTHSSAALLYSSDHGEDLFDDKRGKFLHSSPYPTYYQLRIPMFLWFSKQYKEKHVQEYLTAYQNKDKAITTNSIFPTLLDLAEIKSPYQKENISLINPGPDNKVRLYLNDHDEAVPFQKMNLKKEDFILLKKNHIKY